MFAVDDVLISDAVLDAPFACHLPQCLGGCCVHGDHGAPLEPDERERLEAALPIVERKLWQEALEVIARKGVWIEEEPGKCGTTVVAGRECVFVTYDKAVAKCAHQQAYNVGRLEFEKPISCHRYPLRVEIHGTGSEAIEVLNYEQIRLRKPAIKNGRRTDTQLADFLRKPLSRKYGPGWYTRFQETVKSRSDTFPLTFNSDNRALSRSARRR